MAPYVWVSVVISTLLAIAFAWLMKMTDFRHSFDVESIDWKNIWVPVAGSMCYLFLVYITMHILHLNVDKSDATFKMSQNIFGSLTLIFLCPVLEELVFRDVIIRYMFSKGATPLQALLCSVFCYAMISWSSMGDVPMYFLHGLLFGILFIKTGSVILASVIRVSVGVFQYVCSREFDLLNINTDMPTSYYVVLFFVFTPPTIFLLWKYWKSPLPDGRHHAFEEA